MGVLISRPEDIAVFGRNAAALIGQLEYWLHKAAGGKSKLIVERNGYRWVAMPRPELFAQVALSDQQGRMVLEKLRGRAVLVTRKHLVEGRVLMHYRLDEEHLELLRGGAKPEESAIARAFSSYKSSAKTRGIAFKLSRTEFEEVTAKPCNYCGTPPENTSKPLSADGADFVYSGIDRIDPAKPYERGNIAPCCWTCNNAKASMTLQQFSDWVARLKTHFGGAEPNQKVSKRPKSEMGVSTQNFINVKTEEKTIAPVAQSQGGKSQGLGKEEKMARPKSLIGSYSVKEVTGRMQVQSTPVSISDASTPGQLGMVWKHAWSEAMKEYGGNLTGKQEKQLRMVADKCPRGGGGQVIDFVVRNWSLFTATASARQGAFKCPEMPDPSFLLRFVQSAVQCWQEAAGGAGAASPAIPKPTKQWKVPQKVEPVQNVEADAKVTDLDLAAKLLGLD